MRLMPFIAVVILGLSLAYRAGHIEGFKDGWEGYKSSKNMQFALDSAYKYGLEDCKRGL